MCKMNQYELDELAVEEQLQSGEITLNEYNDLMAVLQREHMEEIQGNNNERDER